MEDQILANEEDPLFDEEDLPLQAKIVIITIDAPSETD